MLLINILIGFLYYEYKYQIKIRSKQFFFNKYIDVWEYIQDHLAENKLEEPTKEEMQELSQEL